MRGPGALLSVLVLLLSACGTGSEAATATSTDSPAVSPIEEVTTAGCDGTRVAAGAERLQLDAGGSSREVERVIPPGYDGSTPMPMIVSLHGFTSNIDQINLFSGLPDAAAEHGYILLTPQALAAVLPVGDQVVEAPFWNLVPDLATEVEGAVDDIVFLLELIDSTIAELCVDADRVYVTGNSNGAGMSTALACEGGERLAAIAPVSGVNLAPECEDQAKVSVIAFHGDADPLVEFGGGRAASVSLDTESVDDRVAGFADAADCDPTPTDSRPFDDIETTRWDGCADGIGVELHTVLGGGHTWPGMLNYLDMSRLAEIGQNQQLLAVSGHDPLEVAGHMTVNIEATAMMLDFFDRHPRA